MHLIISSGRMYLLCSQYLCLFSPNRNMNHHSCRGKPTLKTIHEWVNMTLSHTPSYRSYSACCMLYISYLEALSSCAGSSSPQTISSQCIEMKMRGSFTACIIALQCRIDSRAMLASYSFHLPGFPSLLYSERHCWCWEMQMF